MKSDAETCARAILDAVPSVMAALRHEMRSGRSAELTVPQFRTLVFLGRRPGSSLSDVGRHIGVTPPSASRIVDRLVERGLVTRAADAGDRRRVTLVLTRRGAGTIRRAHAAARKSLAARTALLAPRERTTIVRAMRLLRSLAEPQRTAREPQPMAQRPRRAAPARGARTRGAGR